MPRLPYTIAALFALCLSGCQTVAPNSLSATDTASLKFTSVEVRVPDTARISWSAMEDDYAQSHGYSVGDAEAVKTPEAKAFIAEQAKQRLKAALDRIAAEHQAGVRPVRVVATLTGADIPSAGRRIVVGGHPSLNADVEVVDARTGEVLTVYRGARGSALAGNGIGGVLVDAALVGGGMDDLFARTGRDYANGFQRWLTGT